MKNTRLLPVIVVITSVILSACSGFGFSVVEPTVTNVNVQSAPVNLASAPAAASDATNLSVPVLQPLASTPGAVVPSISADVATLQNAYETIFKNVNPSVVTIEISSQVSTSRSRGGSGQSQVVPTAEGSGFIWDAAGHIVTNNHVVDGAAKISVTFSDGTTYDAKLVGTDPKTDLAVIQVTGAPASLIKPITVGDSSQVQVGQMVVAIGNPFGLSNTMTNGIVSATGRSIQSDAGSSQTSFSNTPSYTIPDIIQTDAAINPGNSGGVLLDMNGALIGVPSQIESVSGSNSGVGFAISSATVSRVVPLLISNGGV